MSVQRYLLLVLVAACVLLLSALWLRLHRYAEVCVPVQSPVSLGALNVRGGLFGFLRRG